MMTTLMRCDCATVDHQPESEGLSPVEFQWVCAACDDDAHAACDGWCP